MDLDLWYWRPPWRSRRFSKPFRLFPSFLLWDSLWLCQATATGKVSHLRGAGSIVSAGELLGTLDLKDPSQAGLFVWLSWLWKSDTVERCGECVLDVMIFGKDGPQLRMKYCSEHGSAQSARSRRSSHSKVPLKSLLAAVTRSPSM